MNRSFVFPLLVVATLAACQRPPADASAPAAVAPAASVGAPASAAVETPRVEAGTAIPDSAQDIWQAIDRDNAELKAVVDHGPLDQVHPLAFGIRDLVAALPAKSPALDAAAKAKLEGEVGFVATLADRLDQSGDANDRAATQASYAQLAAVLEGMTRPPAKP